MKLDADRIFIRDGDVWTSAGISAGIDLALALVEDDLGSSVARRTASSSSSISDGRAGSCSFPAWSSSAVAPGASPA